MVNKIIKLLLAATGKGFGSSSIKHEVRATRNFIQGGIVFDVGGNKGF
jgi:hypothetical protein